MNVFGPKFSVNVHLNNIKDVSKGISAVRLAMSLEDSNKKPDDH